MKNIILLHTIVEVIGGLVLIFKPEFLLQMPEQSASVLVVAKLYGILAFSWGLVGWLVFKNWQYTAPFKSFVMIAMAFHIMVAFHFYGVFQSGLTPNTGAFIVHLTIALFFLVTFMRESEKFKTD